VRRLFATTLLAVLACTAGCGQFLGSSAAGTSQNGTVVEVVDGDTLDVRLANGTTERVRLLGVDTPEVHVETEPEHFAGVPDTEAGRACLRRAGENASAFVERRVAGERVRLESDPTADRRGSYGRLLAYVHHDGQTLNYVLVETGHAGVYPSTFQQRERYETAASTARDADRGLWRCRSAG